MSRGTGRSDLIDIEVELIHETDAAYLVNAGGKDTWIPKSRCELDEGVLTLKESFALEKGLI